MAFFHCDRRHFLALASGATAASALRAQSPSLAHVDVAQMERERVLAEAKNVLTSPVKSLGNTPAPHNFFSEAEPDTRSAGATNAPKLFREQAKALREFSATVACLSAAFLLSTEQRYAARAGEHIRAWLLTPATRMNPSFDSAGCAPGTITGTPAGLVDLIPLAELARAFVFLLDSSALNAAEWDAVREWIQAAGEWLNSSRAALIASYAKDHRGSAWLLIAASFARFSRDEAAMEACRKRFRSPTLRNQIRSDGVFPQEVATPNPYRNTLFNFDLLAGTCQLLSSPFDQLWSYELIDGVGMRIVAAYLYPVIAHPERWTFIADATHFRDLPERRPGLLFAGRAYDRPEYVELWQQLPAGPPPETIADSFPIREPLLWTARAQHGY